MGQPNRRNCNTHLFGYATVQDNRLTILSTLPISEAPQIPAWDLGPFEPIYFISP